MEGQIVPIGFGSDFFIIGGFWIFYRVKWMYWDIRKICNGVFGFIKAFQVYLAK